ncbi:hypothetical protein [Luminiphilus sp. nBUS_07]|uniref:hypothetical protein n=1 Tax=Luminiphilus sp. nBUS_07 TaxID=3395314 RepID=UPI003EC0528A
MKTTFKSLGLLSLLMSASVATATPTKPFDPLKDTRLALAYDVPIEELDPIAMESARGGLAPLALALGIAGVDLALMSFYWGIYVPHYAPSSPHRYTNAP